MTAKDNWLKFSSDSPFLSTGECCSMMMVLGFPIKIAIIMLSFYLINLESTLASIFLTIKPTSPAAALMLFFHAGDAMNKPKCS